MASLSDVRFNKLRSKGYQGSTSDMLLAWLQSSPFGGASAPPNSTVPDAWKAALVAGGHSVAGQYDRNRDWFNYLGGLGYTGAMNDRELQFWTNLV